MGPLVLGDRVILARPGRVEARESRSGALAWSVPVDPSEAPAPAFAARGDLLYVAGERLFAVRVESGEVLWSVAEAPAGTLGADAERLLAGGGISLQALDPASGSVLWRAVLAEPLRVWTLGAGLVCAAGEAIYCHEAATGRLLWSDRLAAGELVADLDVGSARVIVSTLAGGVRAYDGRTGAVLWERALGVPLRGTSVVSALVLACGSAPAASDGLCAAFRESDGAELWRLTTAGAPSIPLAREGTALVADRDGVLRVDPASGRARRIDVTGGVTLADAPMAYAGGVLYVLAGSELVALRLP